MNTTSIRILAALALIAPAASRDIRLADCPEPVRNVIQSNARDCKIEEVEVFQREGKTIYIAEVDLKGGIDLNLYVSAEGALLKTKEDIRLADAPEAVRTTLQGLGGRVDDLDKITEGETVTYDADIERHGQPDLDVIVAADGKVVRQTEDRDDD
ncbi:hypothetical protein OKA04_12620 [Luteolibacter flavescens]|uniref:PepSY domain-containing protein n=1 Tax=Luteolibacter flavescens TaxID=1859460 RepID=A0ABT3FPS8_9BACT|nr:hypothetical protein [Luteolibacter flavescens]MCW1885575.1 hypothetical protein [Luteolibacter flavescens]